MNEKVSSAEKLLEEIRWVHEVYDGTGNNGLEEGAKLSSTISETLADINNVLSSGWASIANSVTNFNNSSEKFIGELYKELVNYCQNIIASENKEAKAVEKTKEASEKAIQQVDALFN